LRQPEYRCQVHADDFVPVGLRIFSRRRPAYCARVVDQDIDGAKFLHRLSDQSRIEGGVSHIAGQIKGLPSQLTNRLAGGLAIGAPPVTSDVCPGVRQCNGDRGAESPARSGYKRVLALELESLQNHVSSLSGDWRVPAWAPAVEWRPAPAGRHNLPSGMGPCNCPSTARCGLRWSRSTFPRASLPFHPFPPPSPRPAPEKC